MNTVLGIDLGTQGLKVIAYDFERRSVAAQASVPLEVDRGPGGRAEQDADAWLEALESAMAALDSETRQSVRAIAVAGQQHGLVAMDASGSVLAPVKLWCDTSTQREVEEITEACGGRSACIELAGNPILTGYTAPKIRWLSKAHADLYRRMAHILLPHDYVNYVLTGVIAMEYGDASGTGLLNVRSRRWSEPILQAVDDRRDLSGCLPPLVAPDAPIGTLTGAAAKRFGLPAGIPVSPGGGDNMMAAIGTGNVSAGRLTMSLGTSGTLFAAADSPVIDDHGNVAAFCSSTGGWLPLLCTLNCTSATEIMRRPLGIGIEAFDDAIERVPVGCDGVTVVPFFAGERTPDLPHATAMISGLDARNCSADHILRATVEGVTFSLRFGLEELRRLGVEAREIALTGGGARSAAWRRVVADVCGLPVSTLERDEGACFGAALQALWILQRREDESVGIADITAEHVAVDAQIEPEPGRADEYTHAYLAYRHAVATVAHSSFASHEEIEL